MMKFFIFLTLLASIRTLPIENGPRVITAEIKSHGSLWSRMKAFKSKEVFYEKFKSLKPQKVSVPYQLSDWYDEIYLIEVQTGTPGQKFNVIPDTGSSNYWLIDGINCKQQACKGYPDANYTKNLFYANASKSYQKDGQPFSITYGSGDCSGVIGIDVLTIGSLSYKTQKFGLASVIADEFGYDPIDGILGLGWPAIAVDNVVPPMQNLLPQLYQPLFTVWMGITNPAGPYPTPAGQIIFGSTKSQYCVTNINYVPLTSRTYWQFRLDEFWIRHAGHTKPQQVISDTGTSFLGGPQIQISMIEYQTGAAYDYQSGLYVIPCDAKGLPDITFTIGGHGYNVTQKEYVLDVGLGNGTCALTIFDFDFGGYGPDWILGDTFIRAFCNIYDIGGSRIGFSKIINV